MTSGSIGTSSVHIIPVGERAEKSEDGPTGVYILL